MASVYELTPVYIPMGSIYGNFNYGFMTRSDITGTGVLGHTPDNDKQTPGVVYGANAPKPPRVRKLGASRVFTTFCAPDKLKEAKANEWQPSSSVRFRGTGGNYRKAYGVPLGLGDAYYGQYLDVNTGKEAITNGGVELLDFAKARKTIFGAQSHKPASVTKIVSPKDKAKESYTFFCADDKLDDLIDKKGYRLKAAKFGVYPAASPAP